MPLSVLFCVSAGSAVTVLHEHIWEASACKTPDHWPVHTLNAVSLSVCRFHLYFVSFPVLSCLIVSPFIPSICPSVCLFACLCFWLFVEGVAWASSHAPECAGDSAFPRSRAKPPPGARCRHAQLQPWPVTPAGHERPSEQCQDTLFWVEGAQCVLGTPGSSCSWKPGNIRNFKTAWKILFWI